MGAWGHLAFDNDTANDWAYELDEVDDLSPVESVFEEIEEVGAGYLDQDLACCALAACEALARCLGRPGYTNSYTQTVDKWVTAHPEIKPAPALLGRAQKCIDRILGEDSELRQLWEESADAAQWRSSIEDLRKRVG